MARSKAIDDQVVAIVNYQSAKRRAENGLRDLGPLLISEATSKISLRALSRRVGLSATYLSNVANRKITMSHKAFLRVAKELK